MIESLKFTLNLRLFFHQVAILVPDQNLPTQHWGCWQGWSFCSLRNQQRPCSSVVRASWHVTRWSGVQFPVRSSVLLCATDMWRPVSCWHNSHGHLTGTSCWLKFNRGMGFAGVQKVLPGPGPRKNPGPNSAGWVYPWQSLSTIALTKDGSYHARTKHINIRYHFIQFKVQKKTINLIYCPTGYRWYDRWCSH